VAITSPPARNWIRFAKTTSKTLDFNIPNTLRRRGDRISDLCPLLAQSGHGLVHCTCPLSGVRAVFPVLVAARTGMTIIDIWALLTQVNTHSDLGDLMAHHE
jgi:hypothetical protein